MRKSKKDGEIGKHTLRKILQEIAPKKKRNAYIQFIGVSSKKAFKEVNECVLLKLSCLGSKTP